jgi:hypothetical protein
MRWRKHIGDALSVRRYRTLDQLRTDPDLAPLRDRDDFQALMMDLEFPSDPFSKDADANR